MPPAKRAERRKAQPGGDHAALLLSRYRRLMELSRGLVATLDLPALLERVALAARDLTEAEHANVLLVEAQSDELRFAASTQADPPVPEDARAALPHDTGAAWVLAHGEPLVMADTAADPRGFAPALHWRHQAARSALAVPLARRGKPLGVLEAVNKRGAGFTADDSEILLTLAALAAAAIETTRLFQQGDLVSEMIHELRTPLASLSATSYMLQRPDLPAERRDEFLQAIQRETARLSNLTNDFLDLARLESGRAHYAREAFAAHELAAECLALVRPQANQRGLTCALALTPEAQACPPVVGDRAKIKQVLLNLLTNAIKYNRPGGAITLGGACREGFYETTVSDTGPGIPAENLPHIFDKFYRVADVESRAPGTGLGLSIAKRIVESHGGVITAESTVGAGTTLRFTLPLQT
jgi:signal transduction histidine kinase